MAAASRNFLKRITSRLLHPFREPLVIRQGEYITFTPRGFVDSTDPSALLCRHNYETRWLHGVLGRLSQFGIHPGRSLEVGCGFGRLSPHIAEHFERHDAVDINEWGVARAKECYPHLNFTLCSATELPFEASTFDAVITWTVLQHLPNNLVGRVLAEINRVLKPNSLIVLCEAGVDPESDRDEYHTHTRASSFYGSAFAGRELLESGYLTELNAIPGLESPGQLMIFGPKKS